jgi:hypothetical protein
MVALILESAISASKLQETATIRLERRYVLPSIAWPQLCYRRAKSMAAT